MKKYDIAIIGSGPGGYVAAIKAGQLGMKVAIVEKEAVGGVCLNWGCIPTKALLHSAKVYKQFKNAKDYGIDVEKDAVSVNFKKMMSRKERIVKKLTGGVRHLLKKNNVDLYEGEGIVKDAHTIKIGDETIETKKTIIATGASPAVPPIKGLKENLEKGNVLTSKEILSVEKLPEKLVIIGAGIIGTEFATIFNTLGSKVTILEKEDDMLLGVDQEIKDTFKKKLKKDGVEVLLSANVDEVKKDGVKYTLDGKSETLKADAILLSTGMRANTGALEALDLDLENGFIKTDEYLRTSVKDVYAIGDVNGRYLLAHVAMKEGVTAVEHIQGDAIAMDYLKVPAGIYTFPEIAQVGLTEEEAKEKDLDYKVSTFPINANGKALAEGQSTGMVKMIATKEYNEIVGVHILSDSATELISEAVLGMTIEATAADIVNAIHPHPTLTEMIHETAHGILDKPLHM